MLNEKRLKVLVVEDAPDGRDVYVRSLESNNYWILEANRYREDDETKWKEDNPQIPWALQLIEAHSFHAAVIDLSLVKDAGKDRQGEEVLTAINRWNEGTNSIVVSMYADDRDVKRMWKDKGAYNYLPKRDFVPSEFAQLIKEAATTAKLRADSLIGTRLNFYAWVDSSKRALARELLGVSGDEEIRYVVEESVRDYFPYDPRLLFVDFEQIELPTGVQSFLLLKLWSRYLGGAVELRVGSRSACQFLELAMERRADKKKGLDFKLCEVDAKDKIVGLLEFIRGKTIIEFSRDLGKNEEE